jgi:integrase/recombinase XerD
MVHPVEYAVAVERRLEAAGLSEGSRRIYRIALVTWAWPLVGRTAPSGSTRRRASPPVVPLNLLDDPACAARLRAACAERAAVTDPRTLNRELSILRGALRWWREQGWITTDPLAGVGSLPSAPVPAPAHLGDDEIRAVLALRAPLREQALWHLLHDTGASIEKVLALNIVDLDLDRRRGRVGRGTSRTEVHWGPRTGRLLSLLLLSRTSGPVFLTDRRAPADTPAADRCPLTGRARLSYRRAAEVFTDATRALDPSGSGWTLRQLRAG